jgi:hypothetical protein
VRRAGLYNKVLILQQQSSQGTWSHGKVLWSPLVFAPYLGLDSTKPACCTVLCWLLPFVRGIGGMLADIETS